MIRMTAASAAVLIALTAALPAPAAELVSHRAFYRLSLASLSSDSEISDVQGGIGYEISDGCDGWIVEQQYAMRVLWSNGNEIDTSDSFVSWESKDGLNYRFNVKKSRNGTEYMLVNGNAELESKGGPGMARFDEPEGDRIALPKGTVFPTEHTVRLLQRARKGEKFDRQLVFDGSEVESAAPVSTVILARRPAKDDGVVKPPLGPHPVWPMKLAFYAAEGTASQGEELPEFELSMDLQENGIATGLVLQFDGFSLNGTLESLKALPEAGC
ncbi:MAG: cell envelope integrity EipB family protein [Alphaproteobacteria bacterium]|nr:cell envelope integrity EipB family protein [Alphaproteobacteria bacterium]